MSKRGRSKAHDTRTRDVIQRNRRTPSKGVASLVRGLLDSSLDYLRQAPRLFAVGHVVLMFLFGAGIGAIICLTVVLGTGKLPVPWTYMSNVVLAIVAKIVASWLDTLVLKPWVKAMAFGAVSRWSGKSVPK